MGETIFHRIMRREIPADIVYEDEHMIAFRDIAPQAPVHVLFVPKEDFATINDVPADAPEIIGRLAVAAARYAKEQGFAETGYRIPLVTMYGATETQGITVVHWITELVGLIGLPLPGITLKLVPNGSKLEVRVKGPTVTTGYHNDP